MANIFAMDTKNKYTESRKTNNNLTVAQLRLLYVKNKSVPLGWLFLTKLAIVAFILTEKLSTQLSDFTRRKIFAYADFWSMEKLKLDQRNLVKQLILNCMQKCNG